MKLYAISDLHLDHKANLDAMYALPDEYRDDWLILAGDISNKVDLLKRCFDVFQYRFAKVFWVPGNHELYSFAKYDQYQGMDKYFHLIELCRKFGVVNPEDDYEVFDYQGQTWSVVPTFLLYDYSFRPDHIPHEKAIDWAIHTGIYCNDEKYLKHDPFNSKTDWCHQRLEYTQQRLDNLPPEHKLILVNHFPLKYSLIRLIAIPMSFSIWCGTKQTEDWHQRYNIKVVVTGHLHMRATDYIDGVRFEEVSLGYPRHWKPSVGLAQMLRPILPQPTPQHVNAGPFWRRYY